MTDEARSEVGVVPTESEIAREVRPVKGLFEQVVFSGTLSIPVGAEHSREVQLQEEELRNVVGEFFDFLEKVCLGDVDIATSGIRDNKDEGRTYSRATLELRHNRNLIPRYQIWVTEIGLKYMDKEEDPEAWSNRIDNRLRAERDKVFNEWRKLAEMNTERAAIEKSRVLKTLINISRIPIESWQIQFQRYEGMRGGRHQITPLIGIRLMRYLGGYQAYPVFFVGGRGVVAFNMPLLRGEVRLPDEISSLFGENDENLNVPFVGEEIAEASPLYRIFSRVLAKAFPYSKEGKAQN